MTKVIKSSKPKVLFLDIETTNLKADWGTLLCFGYKWQGDKKVTVIGLDDFKAHYKKNPWDEKHLMAEVRKVLVQADLTVAHYGVRFDLRYINTKLLEYNLEALPIIPTIDTWRVMKDRLALSSNRLQNFCEFAGFQDKTKLDKKHWKLAARGNQNSLQYVKKHCKIDVMVLERTYKKLLPLMYNHPTIMAVTREVSKDYKMCRVCGSKKVYANGKRATLKNVYQRFRCNDCGSAGLALEERAKLND